LVGSGARDGALEKTPLTGENNQVKFRLDVTFRMAESKTALTGLYFGYTQLSFWNIYDPSAPFLDNNYQPELFLHFDATSLPRPVWYKPSLKLSVSHESNGLDGDKSRGWDRLIGSLELGDPAVNALYATLSGWYVISHSAREQAYTRYLGDAQVGIHWRLPDTHHPLRLGASAITRLTHHDPFVTSLELNLYIDPFSQRRQSDFQWLPSFMVQYFVGTGG
jgi:outer membrane phospholipase A